jgi:tetratricopeptide (TPR) repeat protein
MWEASFDSSTRGRLKILPKLIGSIDEIAGDMDGFGCRAEAASIWRQMILVLKRQFDHAPSEYRVHLGVSWEQYGEFLVVCGREQEARIAEREAAAHGDALCDAGISTFIAPTPTYYRYRQRSLFNFGDYDAACADATKLVDYCRRVYTSENVQHAELLALALLWHREALMRIGRISEAHACLDEAVALVQSEELLDGRTVHSQFHASVSLPGIQTTEIDRHSFTRPHPLRFKNPLTRHFDFYWKTDWGLPYDRAITAQAGAVVCARELYKISATDHGNLLAQTLLNYGCALHAAQQYEAACEAHKEAVNITRELRQFHPGGYKAELADCLRQYGVSLQDKGMCEAASDAHTEAVDITRELFQLHPGKYKIKLSLCFREYGISLHSRHMYEAACDALAEAVNITRGLSRLDPDRYEPMLAVRLQEYGVSLRSGKMYDDACDAHADAVEITRELYRLNPAQFKAKLADHLQDYSTSLHSCQMFRAACDAGAEAVNITRELCCLHPGEYKVELAERLEEYAISLSSKQIYRTARRVMAEAVNITRELCKLHPREYEASLAARLREYCVSLYSISPMRYQDRGCNSYGNRKSHSYKPHPGPRRTDKRKLRSSTRAIFPASTTATDSKLTVFEQFRFRKVLKSFK